MYKPTQPLDQGMLEVGHGQRLHWEVRGSPDGKPAVCLHGGPGSGCPPWWSGFFDPARYRVLLFDQRGAGRSTPSAADPATDLSTNTTPHLVGDLERLREHLGVDRWLVLGGSWGATLGLTYAIRHPDRVSEMVLFAVTATRPVEVEWVTRGVARYFPEAYERFVDGVPPQERDLELSATYARLLASPDPHVREAAAERWCAWESAITSQDASDTQHSRFADRDFRYAYARLVTHYFSKAGFLADDAILGRVRRIQDIPAVLVHGRYDLATPPETAWRITQAWPNAQLHILEGVGHAGSDAMNEAIVAATDRFASH